MSDFNGSYFWSMVEVCHLLPNYSRKAQLIAAYQTLTVGLDERAKKLRMELEDLEAYRERCRDGYMGSLKRIYKSRK